MHYNVINECTSKGGGALSQLTIRGIGIELHNALKESARRKGLSLNRYVVAILREASGLGYEVTPEMEFNDLDHLAGTWTQEVYEEFQEHLTLQRDIDKVLWQ